MVLLVAYVRFVILVFQGDQNVPSTNSFLLPDSLWLVELESPK